MNNFHLGADAQITHQLSLFRTNSNKVKLTDGEEIFPGVTLRIDPQGDIRGEIETGGEALFRISYKVVKPPRWVGLHFAMGAVDLPRGSVLGLVCKSSAAQAQTFRSCLRSGAVEGFVDTFLPKHIVAYAKASTHLDILDLATQEDVSTKAPWRELILFFPALPTTITVHDMRFFVV
jgi:hypothetical protein